MQLVDGFSCILTSVFPFINITLFILERELQPPALDLGGGIETTTMRNMRMRTFAAKALVTLGELTLQCQYDPAVYQQLLSIRPDGNDVGTSRTLLGINGRHTLTFPDGANLYFFGWYDKITPPSHKEGDFPVMEVKICPSNRGYSTAHGGVPVNVGQEFTPILSEGRSVGFVVR